MSIVFLIIGKGWGREQTDGGYDLFRRAKDGKRDGKKDGKQKH